MPTRSKILALGLSSAFLFLPTVVLAEYKLLEPTIVDRTGDVSSPGLGIYLGWLFNAFFAVVAIVTFIQIIITGVSYVTSAIPQVKAVAKDKMGQALFGFALALGAWLILNTISPGTFTNIDLSLENVVQTATSGGSSTPTNPPSTPGQDTGNELPNDPRNSESGPSDKTTQQACDELRNAGYTITSSNGKSPCDGPGSNTEVAGLQPTTIERAQQMKQDCEQKTPGQCNFIITGATEGGHSANTPYDHANGYKMDFEDNDSADNYFTQNFTRKGTRGDGAPLYYSPDGKIVAADERAPGMGTGSHWDVTFLP